MTVTTEKLYAEVRRLAVERSVTEGVAAMWLMTVATMVMAREIPGGLQSALAAAVSRWYGDGSAEAPLEPARIACWRFLDGKDGNTTTIDDRVDIAVRTLICVLWDEVDEGSDLSTVLDFFAHLVNLHGGLEPFLGRI